MLKEVNTNEELTDIEKIDMLSSELAFLINPESSVVRKLEA